MNGKATIGIEDEALNSAHFTINMVPTWTSGIIEILIEGELLLKRNDQNDSPILLL